VQLVQEESAVCREREAEAETGEVPAAVGMGTIEVDEVAPMVQVPAVEAKEDLEVAEMVVLAVPEVVKVDVEMLAPAGRGAPADLGGLEVDAVMAGRVVLADLVVDAEGPEAAKVDSVPAEAAKVSVLAVGAKGVGVAADLALEEVVELRAATSGREGTTPETTAGEVEDGVVAPTSSWIRYLS
jgi:hypothetical protein